MEISTLPAVTVKIEKENTIKYSILQLTAQAKK